MPIDNGDAEARELLAREIVQQLREDNKESIQNEVQRQLQPIVKDIGDIKSWMLGLWSNGSNRPEGYLQRARAEDKRHIGDLLSNQQELSNRVEKVEDYIAEQKIIRAEREKTDVAKANEIKSALDSANTRVNRRISTQNLIITAAALCISAFMAIIALKAYERNTPPPPAPVVAPAKPTTP